MAVGTIGINVEDNLRPSGFTHQQD